MIHHARRKTRALLLAVIVGAAGVGFAQPTGLDALSDDALLSDLADRGLSSMLERAFEINQTPEKKRDALRAAAALSQLTHRSETFSVAQRREVVARVVTGATEIAAAAKDPARLARQVDTLINAGVKLDVNTLEYWGPSTTTRAQLRPVVDAVIMLLNRVEELSAHQVDELPLPRRRPTRRRSPGSKRSKASRNTPGRPSDGGVLPGALS